MNKSYKKLAIPYIVWLYILAIIPVVFMFVLSFINSEGVDFQTFELTLINFQQLGESSTYIAFLNSLWIAATATVICAVLGYVVAYKLARSKMKNKFIILTILILPMWSNILLRTEALGNIMSPQNILSDLLSKIGINLTIDIKGTYVAVLIGLVLTYLPFMVLPIYNTLEKIDPAIEEAALDLGLTESQKFWKIILPMSSKGIVTGAIMTFLPCLSGFAIPEILGSGNIVLIGNIIDSLFRDMNYNAGSLLGFLILIIITVMITIVSKIDKGGETII
jgi:spermidine/putrescine transport system permease protein